MNNESSIGIMDKVFASQGGTIRLAIASICILTVFGLVIENRYQLIIKTKDGKEVSLTPTKEVADGPFPEVQMVDAQGARP